MPGNFVDEVQVNVRGGDGGAGVVSFRRESHTPKGGPSGGDGGSGGDVYFLADRNVASLLAFRDHPHRRAPSGKHGAGKEKHGASGEDLVVAVPEGTSVRARDGALLADLVHHGDKYLAAHGGRGGRGNARFLSNARRAPGFAEQGEYGEELWLRLEVKLLADAALVGFPNSGKSTLISAVSAAKPKIADYPFTTLHPNLGVVRVDGTDFVLADIPGLIEGAHEGAGLGDRFLGHVERTAVLLHLIDATLEDPAEAYSIIRGEVEAYGAGLEDKPEIVALSKADAVPKDELKKKARGLKKVAGTAPLIVSAASGEGVRELLRALAAEVKAMRGQDKTGAAREAGWRP